MSNAYISKLLDITKIQASRNSKFLEKEGYIKIQKKIALRKIIPINKYVKPIKTIFLVVREMRCFPIDPASI